MLKSVLCCSYINFVVLYMYGMLWYNFKGTSFYIFCQKNAYCDSWKG